MESELKYLRGRYSFEEKISRDGELFLAGKLVFFDNTVYYLNIFKNNKYTKDNTLFDKAKELNNKNVIVGYKDVNKFNLYDVLEINETDEISPKIDIEAYKDELRTHIANIKNPSYSSFAKAFMKRVDIKSNFFKAPYIDVGCYCIEGGLLQSTVDKMNILMSLEPFISRYINIDVEFLKIIILVSNAGRANIYEIQNGVAVKSYLGNFLNEGSVSYQMVNECLNSADFKLTEHEKLILLHSCLNNDTILNNTDTSKFKESMIVASVNYFSELINNLLLLKFNNIDNRDFMNLFGKPIYVKNM